MRIRIASREFAPRAFTTVLTVVVFAALIALGRWQVRRAAETQRLWDQFAAGSDATIGVDAATPPLARFRHVTLRGRYDATHQVLIEGMESPDGRTGDYVLTPFALVGGGWILVDRGWVAAGPDNRPVQDLSVGADLRTLRGRADDLPRPGLRLGGGAPLAPPFPVLALYPRHADLAALLKGQPLVAAAPQVLLDPDQTDGYLRHWTPPGFPPMRHTAYAVQWFGLALTLLVIYVVTNLRPAQSEPAPKDGSR